MGNLKRGLSFAIVALSVACLTVLGWFLEAGDVSVLARSPAFLTVPQREQVQRVAQEPQQEVRVGDAWRLVYQQLPNFPLENNYVSKETGKVDPNNTLVGRFIRYHSFVKGRPANYRLDWKLTLADYLGATSEYLEESVYPGSDVLRVNPMERDRTVVQSLNRSQRDALIQVLVDIFSGNAPSLPAAGRREERPSQVAPQPQPGDAKLLMP